MEEVKFPKTFELFHLLSCSNTESKIYEYNDKFTPGENLLLKPNEKANVIKGIKIATESKMFKNISIFINDKCVERVVPEYNVNNMAVFQFNTFNISGVLQNPKLFDIYFMPEPKTHDDIKITVSFHEISLEEWVINFLKYNQYYSVHQREDRKTMLTIYYAPVEKIPYNVKFLDLKDFNDFYKAINESYNWKCPVIYKSGVGKKEYFRLITAEIKPGMLDNDEILKAYESHEVKLSENIISKSFVVHKNERKDIAGHLLAEYGLISYSTVMSSFKNDIDYEQMEKITKSMKDCLEIL